MITPVACRAHARRKLQDIFKADGMSIATEGLQRIGELCEIERTSIAESPEIRRRARKHSLYEALEFFFSADDILGRASARSPLAEALRYSVKLKDQLLAYTDDAGLRSTPSQLRMRCAAFVSAAKTGCLPAPIAASSGLPPCIQYSRQQSSMASTRRLS